MSTELLIMDCNSHFADEQTEVWELMSFIQDPRSQWVIGQDSNPGLFDHRICRIFYLYPHVAYLIFDTYKKIFIIYMWAMWAMKHNKKNFNEPNIQPKKRNGTLKLQSMSLQCHPPAFPHPQQGIALILHLLFSCLFSLFNFGWKWNIFTEKCREWRHMCNQCPD